MHSICTSLSVQSTVLQGTLDFFILAITSRVDMCLAVEGQHVLSTHTREGKDEPKTIVGHFILEKSVPACGCVHGREFQKKQ